MGIPIEGGACLDLNHRPLPLNAGPPAGAGSPIIDIPREMRSRGSDGKTLRVSQDDAHPSGGKNMNRRHVAALFAGIAMAFPAGKATAEEVVLRAVTGVPGPSPGAKVFLEYVDRVNAPGAGIVKIDYMGGPEVPPPPRQGS